MIGNFYPPFLGRIDKIYCGSEQCWPSKGVPKSFAFIADITFINSFNQQIRHIETYLLDTNNNIILGDNKYLRTSSGWVRPTVEWFPLD